MQDRRSAAERQTQARALANAGRTAEGIAYLRASAADLAEDDPAGAAMLLVDAVQPTLFLSGPERALEVAREAVEMARGTAGVEELRASTRLGDAHAWAGDYAEARASWARAATLDAGEQFDVLAPQIGQTFFIGDGTGRSYQVPAGATRLFLGFADAAQYLGLPGYYGNNAGELEVTVNVVVE